MKTITAKIVGLPTDLDMVSICAISSATNKAIKGNVLTATWVIETSDYLEALEEVQESINIEEIEKFNCELIKIK